MVGVWIAPVTAQVMMTLFDVAVFGVAMGSLREAGLAPCARNNRNFLAGCCKPLFLQLFRRAPAKRAGKMRHRNGPVNTKRKKL
jgi:hypothetical protein